MTQDVVVDLSNYFDNQTEFINSEAPFGAAVSGIGGGKTRAGVMKALIYCLENQGALGMITAPTYPMLRDATLRTIQEVWPKELYKLHQGEMRISVLGGSEILLRSTDDPDRLRGPNLAFVYMDEAAQSSHEAWRVLQGRLRQAGHPHQAWITTTPKGYNWVYSEFGLEKRDEYVLFHWSARANPYLPQDFIRRLEESYADDFRLQEIEGQFVVVGGKAFFDTAALGEMLRDCKPPLETINGVIKIWHKPVVAGRYVAAGDVAWGEKGSFNAMPIVDMQTGLQMAELHGRMKTDETAFQVVELCKYYNNAFVGVEANGEGRSVVDKMLELGYGSRMFYRDNPQLKPDRPVNRPSRLAGWWTDQTTRPIMLSELASAVYNRQLILRSADAVHELMSFVRNDRGRPEPAEGAYGDRVMSLAILWQMRQYATFPMAASSTAGRAGRDPVRVPATW